MVLDDSKLSLLAGSRVLVVGDSMLDRYWMGDVNRISPEAPVPVISVSSEEQRMGGAANVAKNISSVGGQPVLLSIVGEDKAGHELEDMLLKAGIESRLQFDSKMKTTVKLRLVSRNQQLLRADFESTPGDQVLQSSLQAYETAIAQSRVVLVSDYGKGGARNISQMIDVAREHGLPVYIDPKGQDYTAYRGATLITPNLHELQLVSGEVYELADINAAAQELMYQLDIGSCLVTLSERGMLLCGRDADPIHQPTRAREVFDVTGAGDTVIAMMALACAANMSNEEAMALANHAAGVVVSKMGTATVSLSEIVSSMRRDQ